MKRAKTALAFLLIATMVISLLAGCAGKNSDTTVKETPEPEQTETTQPAETDEEEVEKIDLTGLKLVVHGWFPPDTWGDPDNYLQFYLKGIEEFNARTGAKVEYINNGLDQNAMMAAMAAGEAWDILYRYHHHPIVAATGLLTPLDEYVDMDDPVFSPTYLKAHIWKGNLWAVNNEDCLELDGSFKYWPSLFEEEGLKTPLEYYKEGNWTWEVMVDLAQKLTKDKDGDGEIDQYGLSSWNLNKLIYSNGGYMYKWNPDGTIESTFDTPENREFYQLYHDLYNKYNIVTPTFDARKEFDEKKIAMTLWPTNPSPSFDLDDKEKVVYVPLPQGPNANGKYYSIENNMGWMIPAGAKNPEASYEVIRALVESMSKGIASYEWSAIETAVQKDIRSNMVYVGNLPNVYLHDFGPVGNRMWGVMKDEPLATAIEKFKTQLEQQVDVYNQTYSFR